MDNMIYCNNCGRIGHQYHQCKLPITSYGVIAFKISKKKEIKYLLIRRKDTLGYVDFIRGKYTHNNMQHILNMLKEMTLDEKDRLCTDEFKQLWNNMWGMNSKTGGFQRIEEKTSSEKLQQLKEGVKTLDKSTNNYKVITLNDLIKNTNTNWIEPEWGFPKGRRNHLELDVECALREWEEETGYKRCNIDLIQNLSPFEETFTGSNYKSYKHKYYIALFASDEKECENENENENENNGFDKTEVGKLEWKTYNESKSAIRPYNIEKLRILDTVHEIVTNHILGGT
tara:strand:+ start:187 stop:1041 length:855 start_codon:yes stop_codon:yes gene_type:complete